MTAPVTLEPVARSEKIAMTAPVTAEPVAADASMATATQWRIQFVMPGQYSMQTLPKPVNPAVSLRELPA
ncbi:MAG: heme-binding protein, partial [Ferruginibacter sp.]